LVGHLSETRPLKTLSLIVSTKVCKLIPSFSIFYTIYCSFISSGVKFREIDCFDKVTEVVGLAGDLFIGFF